METPFEILNISDRSTVDQVKARWRELAAKTHPDRGGDAEEFDRLNKAYKAALELADKPLECEACRGTGRVEKRHGFNVATTMCHVCGGSGEINRI